MKIYPDMEIKQPVSVGKKQPAGSVEKTAKVDGGDKVDFTAQLKQVQSMENQFSLDSTRQARLQEVKEQIAKGAYAPDLRKVAASLLRYIVKGGRDE